MERYTREPPSFQMQMTRDGTMGQSGDRRGGEEMGVGGRMAEDARSQDQQEWSG